MFLSLNTLHVDSLLFVLQTTILWPALAAEDDGDTHVCVHRKH